ncbi:hypothetical protein RYX36_023242 [Vicia faba]
MHAFLLSLALCAPFLSYADRSAEIQALTSFKLNLHDPLGALDGWDTSSPEAPCDWRNVACNNDRVTELRLPRLQLSGRLSERLSELSMLKKISLHSNFFNGSIPSSLMECKLLRFFFLQDNAFSGNVPPEIGNLTGLQIFNVAQNHISRTIPRELPLSLKYLDLSSNIFSVEIPETVANLPHLQLINLSYN